MPRGTGVMSFPSIIGMLEICSLRLGGERKAGK